MSVKVDAGGLSDAVQQVLNEFNEDYIERVNKATEEGAKAATEYLKQNSPRSKGRRSGTYAKSWRSKIASKSKKMPSRIVHSPKQYRLTHLLEHGHNVHGKPGKRTRAFPHIKKAEEIAIQKIEEVMSGD